MSQPTRPYVYQDQELEVSINGLLEVSINGGQEPPVGRSWYIVISSFVLEEKQRIYMHLYNLCC